MTAATVVAHASTRRTSVPVAVGAGLFAAGCAVLFARQPNLAKELVGTFDLAALGLIAFSDARTLKAPNRIVYPSLGLASVGAFLLGSSDGFDALGGGAVALGVLLVVALMGRGAMGFGDVKTGML